MKKSDLIDFGLVGLKYGVIGAKALLMGIECKDAETIVDAIEFMDSDLHEILHSESSMELIALAANIWSMNRHEGSAVVKILKEITKRENS